MIATVLAALLPRPKIDPKALDLLRHCAAATFALRTYQAECRTVLASADPKRPPEFELATLRAAKPNLLRYDHWDLPGGAGPWARPASPPGYVFACDGRTFVQQFGRSYADDHSPAPGNLHTISEPWTGFWDRSDSDYARALDARRRGELVEVRLDGEEAVDGVRCRKAFVSTRGDYNGEARRNEDTVYVGPDGLLRRKVARFAFGDRPALTRDSTLNAIRKDAPIPESAYAYVPPKGVVRDNGGPKVPPLPAGVEAPDFEATDAGGGTVRLSDLRGKVVVLDFWAAWCAPCMASMPHNQEVVARLQREGLPVVLLAVDDAEPRDAFLRVARSVPRKYPNLRMVHVAKAGSVSAAYRVSSLPTQYVVGADGTVRATLGGYAGPTDELERAVRATLAPRP